jgi:hypothetical protein
LEKIENIKGQELLNNILYAFRFQIAHSKALNTSKKAEILFEKSNACEEYELKAKMYLKQRNLQLMLAKGWIVDFFEKIDDNQRSRFEEFFKQNRYQDNITISKQMAILHILHSNVSHEDTKELKEQLDEIFKELEEISSLEDIYKYTINKLDDFIEWKKGNPWPIGLCLFLLILLFLGLFTLVAILVCIISASFGGRCYIKEWHERLYKECGLTAV